MHRSGQYTVAVIAKALGVSRASIYRHLTCTDGYPAPWRLNCPCDTGVLEDARTCPRDNEGDEPTTMTCRLGSGM
jgi:hypothetical protein